MVTMLIGSKTGIYHLDNTTWKCSTELRSDVLIEVEDFSFFLHKFPLINTSPLLRKLIGKYSSEEEDVCRFSLHEIPGGAQSFELIAKFCYGEKFELTPTNVVAVLCAAHHLGMHEDYMAGNLISQAEDFLFKKVLSNWKASIAALLSCEDVGHSAEIEKLDIVSRCLEAISGKVRIGKLKHPPQWSAWNGIDDSGVAVPKAEAPGSNWWHDDVSALSLPLFKRLIGLLGRKGHDPADISSSVISYWNKVHKGLNPNSNLVGVCLDDLKLSLEETVALLPVKKGATPIKTLFSLLSASLMYCASTECIESLETEIGAQLDESKLGELLGPDLESTSTYELRYESKYGIDCIQRIIEQFAEENLHGSENTVESEGEQYQMEAKAKVAPVAKLFDEYLTKIAKYPNLNLQQFKSLASAIPASARPLNDDLYRAIDVYLECHPSMSEEQKEQLCQLVDIEKLSREACGDMVLNQKLPPRVTVRVMYVELRRLTVSRNEPEPGGQRQREARTQSETERKNVVRQWQRQGLKKLRRQGVKKLQHCNRIVKKLINKVENAAAALPKTNWKPIFSRKNIMALPPIPAP